MGKKLSVGVLAASLLLSGLLVGVSYGDAPSKAIVEPTEVRLVVNEIVKGTHPVNDARISIVDADGNDVGFMRWLGRYGDDRADWHLTVVYGLQPGPYTERGTVVVTGIFRGFSGESLAVTGGTGAYSNVRGSMKLSVEGDDTWVSTLYLTP